MAKNIYINSLDFRNACVSDSINPLSFKVVVSNEFCTVFRTHFINDDEGDNIVNYISGIPNTVKRKWLNEYYTFIADIEAGIFKINSTEPYLVSYYFHYADGFPNSDTTLNVNENNRMIHMISSRVTSIEYKEAQTNITKSVVPKPNSSLIAEFDNMIVGFQYIMKKTENALSSVTYTGKQGNSSKYMTYTPKLKILD